MDMLNLLNMAGEKNASFRYAEEKWSVKEVLGHIVDAERVFSYRALCIARGEKQSLPSFDENEYVQQANFDKRTLRNLLDEYDSVRLATVALFKSFSEEILMRKGIANGESITVQALLYIIAGHEIHHRRILDEKYLSKTMMQNVFKNMFNK